jgi:TRAP transporter TAXI family solute receptor
VFTLIASEAFMKIVIGICAALLMGGPAMAQRGAQPMSPTILSLGTATPGGGFPLYGDAFAEVMNAADPGLQLRTQNTKGSTENIPLLEEGKLDLALVAGEPAYEAFKGIKRAPTRLKILTALYSNPGMFVVRADSPYRTIRDLVGKPVAFGARGSGLVFLSRYVLDGLGLDQDKDFQAVYLDRAGDGPAMVLDGRVAALWGAGIGWPGYGRKPRWCALHRAGCSGDRADQGQAQLSEAAADRRQQLSEPAGADRISGVVELYSRARDIA